MAQTNFTPISLYFSTTAAAAPTAGNMVNGELAINITDGKLYYKDNAGVVKVIAGAGGAGIAGGSNTQVQFNSSGNLAGSANMVFDGSTLTTLNSAYTGTLTGGNGVVNLGSGQFYKDAAGNIGMGSTSPTALFGTTLQIGNSSFSSTLSLIGTGAGTTGDVYLAATADTASLVARASTPLVFGTNNIERVRIDASGNVGIGTNSPSAQFEVYNVSTARIRVNSNANLADFAQNGTSLFVSNNANGPMILQTNNTERMRIDGSGNVGIGTSSVDARLTVQGPTAQSSFTGAAYGAALLRGASSVTNYTNLDFATAASLPAARIGMLFSSSGSSLQFGTSNNYGSGVTNTAMTIDPSGNVGIGTSTPTSATTGTALNVFGSTNAGIRANSATVTMDMFVAGTTGFIQTGSNHSLAIRTNSVTRMILDTSGNVGVGTTSSTITDKFTVAGAGEVGGISDAGSKESAIRVSSVGGAANDGGQIEFGAGFGSYAQSYFAGIKGLLNNGSSNSTGNLAFYTRNAVSDTSLTERMRITSAGDVFVGGTTGAVLGYEKFSVYGSGSFKTTSSSALGLWNTASSGLMTFYTDVGTLGGTVSSSSGSLSITGGTNLFLSSGGSSVVTINTNGIERIRATAGGAVGIGTSVPGNNNLLTVGTITGVTTASMVVLQGGNTITNNFGNCIEFGHSNAAGYRASLGAWVGTGAPFIALCCEAGTTSNTFRTRGLTGTVIYNDTGGATVFSSVTNPNADNQTAVERMRITNGGNVGIGTSSPSNTLQVTNGTNTQIRVSESTLSFWFDMGRDGSDGLFQINGNQGSGYKWFNAGSEVMRINSSGNVGIGTNSPAQKLDVRGNAVIGTGAGQALLYVNGGNSGTSGGAAITFGGAGSFINAFGYSSAILGGAYSPDLLTYAGGGNIVLGSAANIIFSNNGRTTEYMRITSAGNVGIGTSSPSAKLDVRYTSFTPTSSIGTIIAEESTAWSQGIQFYINNAGTFNSSRPSGAIGAANSAGLWLTSGAIVTNDPDSPNGFTAQAGSASIYRPVSGAHVWFGNTSLTAGNTFTATERMRIDANGNLLFGTADSAETTGVGVKFISSATLPIIRTVLNRADTAGVNTFLLYNTNATNNAYRFYVNVNGGIYNFSGNNSNLSDERTKTNIELASNYLNKICSIPVKLFNYKDEANGEQKTLGVIAQDVEAVAPELVNNEGFGETKEGEQPLKSIYTTDMMFAMMKAIQEQQTLINQLTTRLNALEGK
jgi:trimeric autotransporter adhesin